MTFKAPWRTNHWFKRAGIYASFSYLIKSFNLRGDQEYFDLPSMNCMNGNVVLGGFNLSNPSIKGKWFDNHQNGGNCNFVIKNPGCSLIPFLVAIPVAIYWYCLNVLMVWNAWRYWRKPIQLKGQWFSAFW